MTQTLTFGFLIGLISYAKQKPKSTDRDYVLVFLSKYFVLQLTHTCKLLCMWLCGNSQSVFHCHSLFGTPVLQFHLVVGPCKTSLVMFFVCGSTFFFHQIFCSCGVDKQLHVYTGTHIPSVRESPRFQLFYYRLRSTLIRS